MADQYISSVIGISICKYIKNISVRDTPLEGEYENISVEAL